MLSRHIFLTVTFALFLPLLASCGGESGDEPGTGEPATATDRSSPTSEPDPTATPTMSISATAAATVSTAATATTSASAGADETPSVLVDDDDSDVVDGTPPVMKIAVVNVDGSGAHQLTDHPESAGAAAWSPDGSLIAFLSPRGDGGIFTMNPDGSDVRRIADIDGSRLAWSPDGRHIGVGSTHGYAGDYPQIYLVAADGSSATQLTSGENPPTATQSMGSSEPAWSPDGSQIAFTVSQLSGASDLYVMSSDGSDLRLLAGGDGRKHGPSWSPDGTLIAFSNDAQDGDIWVVRPDGSDLRNLTSSPVVENSQQWSPTSGELVFVRDAFDLRQIVAIAPDGTNERVIFESAEYVAEPGWSPDGSRIAFAYGHPEKDTDVFVINADGSDVRQLTDTPELESGLAWSPDGTSIAYTVSSSEETEK